MGKSLIVVFLIGATVSGLISCGTTHHFLPANPIPRKEWQLSINWHYDFDGQLRGMCAPELSCYAGVGKNWNLGFGLAAPIFVTHVTSARYYGSSSDHPWMAYLSTNQVLGLNDNPYFEVGALGIEHERAFDQVWGVGLAYGNGLGMPLPFVGTSSVRNNLQPKYRLMPLIRYEIIGRDFAASYVHYHGKTAASLAGIRDSVLARNDTLFVVERLQADSIRKLDGCSWRREWLFGIFLSNGDTLVLSGRAIYPDRAILASPWYREGDPFWGKFSLRHGGIYLRNGKEQDLVDGQSLVVSIADLQRRVESKDRFAITRFDPRVEQLFGRWRSFVFDHSIGISIMHRSK